MRLLRKEGIMFEYHVHMAKTVQGVEAELEKRSAEGWELMSLLSSPSGWFTLFGFLGSIGTRWTMVFRRSVSAQ